MKISLRVLSVLMILSIVLVACGANATQAPSGANATQAPSGSNEKVDLTFWYWAESDAPGADAWMTNRSKPIKRSSPMSRSMLFHRRRTP